MKTKGLDCVLPLLISRWYTDDFAIKNPQFVSNRINMIQEMDLKTFCRVFWIYADCMMEDWIHKIRIPTLVMTGELDFSCNPRINKMIVKAMPDARLEILKDLRHSITGEKPDLVAKKIRTFYEEIENNSDSYYQKRFERIKTVNFRSNINNFAFHLSNPFTILVRNFFLKYLTRNKNFLENYLGKIYKN